MFLIGIIIFWVSTLGYVLFLNKKTKLPYSLSLPFVFTIITLVVFIAGIINIIKIATLVICVTGFLIFLYYLIKKQIDFKRFLSINCLLFIAVIIYITIVCKNMHFLHYDNFSHWALMVKTMFMYDRFPNFENTVIMFKNYQPGSACFIYYVGVIIGKTESNMIIAQNYLVASYLFSMLIFAKNKIKSSHIIRVVILSFYLLILLGNIEFYDLLVDTLLAVIMIYSAVLLYYFRDDLKKAFIYNIPVCMLLFLVKNTGIVLVCFTCLGLLYLGIRNKKFKISFIYAIATGLLSLFIVYIWQRHVINAYGALALDSKHSLSMSNIIHELHDKGRVGIIKFIRIYWHHFFDISNNLPHLYMIGINIVTIIIAFINKKSIKKITFFLIIGDLVYLMYYGVLGVMYLLSMPTEEAMRLASFDRYMLTIVLYVIGLLLIIVFSVIEYSKSKRKVLLSSVIIIVSLLLTNITLNLSDNYDVLWGKQNYEDTNLYKLDNIIKGSKDIFYKKDTYYYIYAPTIVDGELSYFNYVSKYKLNTTNYKIIGKTNQIINDDNYKHLVVVTFENDKIIGNYLKDNHFKINGDKVYIE